MPTDKKAAHVATCQCPLQWHQEFRINPDGSQSVVAVLDEDLPEVLDMCVGRCERCGLPYQSDFPND